MRNETSPHPFYVVLGIALLGIGLVARVAPLADHDGRLLSQFPTEDGYLMLTMGRNLALGNGLSTAGGTIATNGTQPLCTFLWALCFLVVGGERHAGVFLVQVLQIAFSAATAYALFRLGRVVLAGRRHGYAIAGLAACAWYATATTGYHTQNCLETGAYALVVVLALLVYVHGMRDRSKPWSSAQCLGLGLVLGLAFLTRNDACLFILAVCLVHWLSAARSGRSLFFRRLWETCVIGITSVVVATPWLVYNRLHFGSVVPISGIAESLDAQFGQNLALVPACLAEYVLTVVPVPNAISTRLPVIAGCSAVILVAGAVHLLFFKRTGTPGKAAIAIVGLSALFLSCFYGLYFGAGHFMNRYLFPLSPFLAISWAVVVCHALGWLRESRRLPVAVGFSVALLVLVAGLNARIYLKGKDHMHFQVVEWVAEHVDEEEWVGAIQSGTLGFFHDRTINLDGKVNPHALAARTAGTLPDYVEQTEIRYLVDWVGIASFLDTPGWAAQFDLLLRDPDRNLCVLERRSSPNHPGSAVE